MTAVQQITDSQIINIHRLRFSGLPYSKIRDITGHSLTTIHDHCTGIHAYPPKLAEKIRKYRIADNYRPKEIPEGWLTIQQASLLLPLNPTKTSIYKRIRTGSLKTQKFSGIHATRLDWIDDHISKRLGDVPRGVAILHNDLDLCLLDEPPQSFYKALPAFPVDNRPASLLFDVNKACTEYGLRIEIPAIVHSRVARALTYGARFVLIHEGMFA
jgi:hypothetical protein